ncbi:hypothetical protein BJX99DRAFT_258486 [Aspergillus californicus]
MSNEPKVDLSTFLGPSLPSLVNTLWFQHIPNDQSLTLPSPEVFGRWFTQDATFDLECATQFKPILEAIHQTHLGPQTEAQVKTQAEEILDLVKPRSGLDWLGLILLLDQLPRNCYRGVEAALVFTFFDPIARVLALRALGEKVDSSSPEIRYRLGLRHWFYLPLMHSEDLGHQQLCLEQYRKMAGDIHRLLDESPKGLSGKELAYRETLAGNRKAIEEICAQNLKFQKEHHDIIAQFGRYPFRNKTMGRESTQEEEKFLREENISFG